MTLRSYPENAPVYHAQRVIALLGNMSLTAKDLTAVGPPPEPVPGFLTFWDPGWDILSLREVAKSKGRIFYQQSWYDNEEFAKLEEAPRWRQIRMDAVNGSFSKTFAEQQQLLAKDEEVPFVRQVVMGVVIHFLATGVRLFPACWGRCLDKDAGGSRVYVGDFDDDGLRVFSFWSDDPNSYIGLACARKL